MQSAEDAAPPRRHVVVVGGGIGGLAAALGLLRRAADVDVTVLEGSPAVGGKLLRGEVAGRTVDLGAESMLNRRPEAVDLAREVGLESAIVYPAEVSAAIWTRGRLARLPAGLMGVPADPIAAARSGVLSWPGALRAAAERWLPARPLRGDVSVGRLVEQRLGPEVRDRLVEPLLGGVYAGHADELSLHATVPQLASGYAAHHSLTRAAAELTPKPGREADTEDEADSDHARKGGIPNDGATGPPSRSEPVFAGLSGGVGQLAERAADLVQQRGGVVRTSAMVRELHRDGSGWRLVAGPARAPETIRADAVVVAVPAVPASRLLRGTAPAAARALGTIEYASMAIVTLALPGSTATDARVAAGLAGLSGFLVPPVDGRGIKAATFSSLKWDWVGTDPFVLRCSIGRHRDERALQRDDAELVDIAMEDLHEAVGLHGPLVDATVTRWGGGLPQYTVGHLDRVARIRAAVAEVPGLAVCGAAYDGVGIPAVIASAEQAATQVTAHLESRGTMAP